MQKSMFLSVLKLQFLPLWYFQYLLTIQPLGLFGCLLFAHLHSISHVVWSIFAKISLAHTEWWYSAHPLVTWFSWYIRFSCVLVLLSLIILLIVFLTLRTDLSEGLIISFPLYFLKFQPRKSKPSWIDVNFVFSSDRINPLCPKNAFSISFISVSVSLSDAVTTKSSAYFIRCTFFLLFLTSIEPFLLLQYFCLMSFSIPSSVIFARVGDIIPPCGVPLIVGYNLLLYTYPHFMNSLSTFASIGIFSSNHLWLMLSKQPFISPSNTHCGESLRHSTLNPYSIASWALLYFRNPNDTVSASVSATGSSPSNCNACIARSFMVGIPSGRFSFFPNFSI